MPPAPSQMTERLAQQLEKRARLDTELLQQQRKLAQSAAEQQTMADKEATLLGQRAKLQTLRESLTKQHEAVLAQWHERDAADKELRAQLNDELTARIKDINERVERENAEWTAAVSENARLKEKIGLVEESIANGTSKFDALLDTREKEFGDMTAKSAKLEEANVELEARIKAAMALVEERAPGHKEARERAEALTARFQGIQDKIGEANNHFNTAKATQAKLAKRLKTLESERETTLRGVDRVRQELATELALERKVEGQLQALVAATEKIINVTKALQEQLDNPSGNKAPAAATTAAAAADE